MTSSHQKPIFNLSSPSTACPSEHPIRANPSPVNASGCRAVNHSLARESPSTDDVCPLTPLKSRLSLNSSFPESCRNKIYSLLCS
ncbi:hypothetical protein PAL_GLEAN10005373 [Pteropus alecto]|uniref:Uncharacterized protein n=1 Tax=Pteropus alecto TaxID=9402 RepID=L5JTJ9_PTEAL|nr:hypothetical protein PAL_GLEAN10005373 [Pteropus alecto]